MKLPFIVSCLVGAAVATPGLPSPRVLQEDGRLVAYLFEKPASVAEQERLNSAFLKAMEQVEADQIADKHEEKMESFLTMMDTAQDSFSGYKHVPVKPVCSQESPNALAVRTKGTAVAAFPGGILADILNFNMAKLVDKLAQSAASSAGASGGVGGIIAMQAIMMAAMMIQGVIAGAIHIIPPLIPPPPWNNQPLMCMPMITGMNCFGTIIHRITVSDFIMATSTDMMVKGYISSFPQTYADKVGYTPDPLYKACFSAFMGMHCAAIFPRCSAPQTGNDPTTKSPQRSPLAFFHCIGTLVACPGFWIDDIIGPCEEVTLGLGSFSIFWRFDLLPPQFISVEGSTPSEEECPESVPDLAQAVEKAEAAVGRAGGETGAGAGEGGAGATDVVKLPTPA